MISEEHQQGTAFVVGRFQPITTSHYQIIDDARKKYQQTYVIVVYGLKSGKDKKKNPFSLALRMNLVYKAFAGKLHQSHILSSPTGFTPDVLERLYNYISKDKSKKKIVLFCGSDRVKNYRANIEQYFKRENVEIEVVEISRDIDSADNVSSTKVREALKSGDEELFKKMTPSGIHGEFNFLRKFMMTESQRSFFRKMLLEITHLEDLNVKEFVDFVRHIYDTEASVKLDGRIGMMIGIDEEGRFFTSLAKITGDVKEEKKRYSVEDWLKDNSVKVNAAVSAHKALESKMDILKKFVKPGEKVNSEVLFGDKPNCIRYDFGGTNYLVILNNQDLGEALKGKVQITVPNFVIESDSLQKKTVDQIWDFGKTEIVDVRKFSIDVEDDLKDLEKFLESETEGFRNIDILGMKALGKKAPLVKKVREKAQSLKLNVKEKLLQQFVRKVQGGVYKPAEGYSHEGIVFKKGDQLVKIIDKEVFTKSHDVDWEPAHAAKKIAASSDKQKALETIEGMIKNFDQLYPNIKDEDVKARMKEYLRMVKIELRTTTR